MRAPFPGRAYAEVTLATRTSFYLPSNEGPGVAPLSYTTLPFYHGGLTRSVLFSLPSSQLLSSRGYSGD